MYLARDVETMLRPTPGNVTQSRFRYQNRYGPSHFGSSDGQHSLGRANVKGLSGPRPVERSTGGHFDGNRVPVSSKPGFSSSYDLGLSGNRDRGIRSLSRTEWEDRRKKFVIY